MAVTFSIVARLTLEVGESSVPASAVPLSDADAASEAAWPVSVGVTERDLPVMPHRPLGLTNAPRSAALCSSAESRGPQLNTPGPGREHHLARAAKPDCSM